MLKIRFLAVAVVAAFAITVAPAGAQQGQLGRTVLVGGNAKHRTGYQAWIDAAATSAKQANAEVRFRESNCPGVRSGLAACVISSPQIGGRLRFYIPRQLRNSHKYAPSDLKNTVLHELGHVYDFLYTGDSHRGSYMKIFKVRGRFYSDHTQKPPYEKFAVGYSYCAEGLTVQAARKRKRFDLYDYRFTAEQYAAFCSVLKP